MRAASRYPLCSLIARHHVCWAGKPPSRPANPVTPKHLAIIRLLSSERVPQDKGGLSWGSTYLHLGAAHIFIPSSEPNKVHQLTYYSRLMQRDAPLMPHDLLHPATVPVTCTGYEQGRVGLLCCRTAATASLCVLLVGRRHGLQLHTLGGHNWCCSGTCRAAVINSAEQCGPHSLEPRWAAVVPRIGLLLGQANKLLHCTGSRRGGV